jgi:hypothetical protein
MRKRFMRCVFELNFLLSKEHESNNLKQDLLKDLKDGKTVYAPATKKRKRSSELEKSRKKMMVLSTMTKTTISSMIRVIMKMEITRMGRMLVPSQNQKNEHR